MNGLTVLGCVVLGFLLHTALPPVVILIGGPLILIAIWDK